MIASISESFHAIPGVFLKSTLSKGRRVFCHFDSAFVVINGGFFFSFMFYFKCKHLGSFHKQSPINTANMKDIGIACSANMSTCRKIMNKLTWGWVNFGWS